MAKVQLMLKKEQTIAGKKHPAGTVVLEGECRPGFTCADLDQGIQMKEICAQEDLPKVEPKKKKEAPNKE